MVEKEVNCIGYVAHQLGFDPEERFIHCPGLEEALAVHDVVLDAKSASLVGIVSERGTDNHSGPTIIHLAILEEGGDIVRHRKQYGAPVTREPFERGLDGYLKSPRFRVIYLTLKG